MTLAETPMDFHGYGIWLLIFIVIACLIFWVRHNPTTVASIRASLEKLTGAHEKLVDTHTTVVNQSNVPPWERK